MKIVKYRFNRKVGKVFLDEAGLLTEVGNSLKMIVLWVSEPTYGKPFEGMPAQDWVQLTFIDEQGNWCYSVLSSGSTNALSPWIEYRNLVEKSSRLMGVVTTISFEEIDGQNQWFDYKFSGTSGVSGLADRMLNVIHGVDFPLIEPLGLVKDIFAPLS
jgi:hypothetical protein